MSNSKRKYGLLGKNISYSLSPFIFNTLAKYYNIEDSVEYEIIDVDNFSDFDPTKYNGINVTTPYKHEASCLYTNTDINCLAGEYANCIDLDNDCGYNTDYDGLEYVLYKQLGIDIFNINRVVIVGSGATSKLVKGMFVSTPDCEFEVVQTSRKAPLPDSEIHGDILINTTLCGQGKLEDVCPINPKLVKNFKYIVDLNYNPDVNPLMLAAKYYNIKHANGIYMLLVQALKSFWYWNKIVDPNWEETLAYLKKEVDNYRFNGKKCLIGAPYSGKTTEVDKLTNSVDLDAYIAKYEEKHVSEIINELGIDYFRDLETKYLQKIVDEGYINIALGGGTILNYQNLYILRNYQIVWLDTDINILLDRYNNDPNKESRPLIKSDNDLINLYNERKIYYQNWETK